MFAYNAMFLLVLVLVSNSQWPVKLCEIKDALVLWGLETLQGQEQTLPCLNAFPLKPILISCSPRTLSIQRSNSISSESAKQIMPVFTAYNLLSVLAAHRCMLHWVLI